MVAYNTGSDPIEIGDLGSKVKVTVTQYQFLLHNSLLTSLLYNSAFLCLIKLKFGMPLTYADLYVNFIKIKSVMTSGFLHTNVYIPNSAEPTNFIFGTNIQQHKIDIMIKVQVTLSKAEGHK